MSFRFVHVGFNFTKSSPPVSELEQLFNKAKDWMRYSECCWILYTHLRLETWRDRIRRCKGIADSDSFFLCVVHPNEYTGYLQEDTWEWIHKERSTDISNGS